MQKYNKQELHNLFKGSRPLHEPIAQLEAVQQGSELTQVLKTIAKHSGYECLAFIDYAPVSTTTYEQHQYGKYSACQAGHFDNEAIYSYCKTGFRISAISSLITNFTGSEQLYVLPLHGLPGIVGALIFSIPQDFVEIESIELIDWYWTILSPYLLNAAIRCRSSHFRITSREKDCLLWASEGKTSWEISQILGISERTVNFHLTNCIEKTQSANRQQAIVKCLINNII
ncbi:helix-turn-helix transcriptional regulator [Pseudoalteromonas rubra]|uniref:helix-turn-helix transcriptional regulator n=1 Tax=Pseudoalteromonas rubra TaxID=43658 RepID=UPI000F770747|nr:helix-turn-helix transcriptional regulator [Pseudoalteromonas rubra]